MTWIYQFGSYTIKLWLSITISIYMSLKRIILPVQESGTIDLEKCLFEKWIFNVAKKYFTMYLSDCLENHRKCFLSIYFWYFTTLQDFLSTIMQGAVIYCKVKKVDYVRFTTVPCPVYIFILATKIMLSSFLNLEKC